MRILILTSLNPIKNAPAYSIITSDLPPEIKERTTFASTHRGTQGSKIRRKAEALSHIN